MPVFGGFEPTIYLRLGLGNMGIVTVLKNVVCILYAAITQASLERRATSIRTLDMPVIELQDHNKLMTNFYTQCLKVIECDSVSVLV